MITTPLPKRRTVSTHATAAPGYSLTQESTVEHTPETATALISVKGMFLAKPGSGHVPVLI